MAQNKNDLLAVLQLLRKHNLKVLLSWSAYQQHNLNTQACLCYNFIFGISEFPTFAKIVMN